MANSFFGASTRSRVATRARAFGCGLAVAAVVCALPATASASPGQVDPTFGHLGNGTVLADHGREDVVVKVLHQPDGKIVSVMHGLTADGNSLLLVARYLTNGSLDPSFGTGGVFSPTISDIGFVTDAALQPDGKIVIVGSTTVPAVFITRLLASGRFDPAFVAAAAPKGPFDEAAAVALDPGGAIVVAGHSGGNLALWRYTSSGALDATFSGDGMATESFSAGVLPFARDVAVLPDHHIVVTGNTQLDRNAPQALLTRFDANGTLDATFGTAGRVAPASTPIQTPTALLVQGTKLVIAGRIDLATAGISRYNANGTIDPTFGSAGTARAQIDKVLYVSDLVADGSGRLVAVGEASYSDNFPDVRTFAALLRYSANGAPDATFGCGGRVLTELLGNGQGTTYDAAQVLTAVAAGNDIIVGGDATHFDGNDFPPLDSMLARYKGDPPATSGYALLRGDGGTSAFGGAPACGSVGGLPLNAPVVGIALDPVAAANGPGAPDGGVFSFGAARFLGSMGAVRLNQPIVGMAAAPDGNGYWLVARDGGVFSFGSAHFFGSTGAMRLNQPVVGMAAARDGKGYWLVARDGGVFSFGSAKFAGSTGAMRLNQPVVGMAADRDGAGYWLVASDGGVFAFDAKFVGSTGAIRLNQPVVGMAADPDGTGYWMAARDGGVFAFDAQFSGSTGATPFPVESARSTIGIAATG
jgi:uncharacterized delta-60 repeat protein